MDCVNCSETSLHSSLALSLSIFWIALQPSRLPPSPSHPIALDAIITMVLCSMCPMLLWLLSFCVVSYFLVGIYFARAEAHSGKCGNVFFGLKRHTTNTFHACRCAVFMHTRMRVQHSTLIWSKNNCSIYFSFAINYDAEVTSIKAHANQAISRAKTI